MFIFLKNKVGRPSNEVIMKRKIFYFICSLSLILLILLGIYSLMLYSPNDKAILQTFDLNKLSGNISNIGNGTLDIKYIDNIKDNSAVENTSINIKQKMNYTGTNNIYYRQDLYQNNKLISKGTCRIVDNNKLATITFKLVKDKLNVITGIYNDSNCNNMLKRYRTKKYYIASDDNEDKVELPSIELPKYNTTWYVGDISESFSLNVTPKTSSVTLISSNSTVMEVITQGVNSFRLKAIGKGNVVITATSSDGVTASVNYTVKEKNEINMTKFSDNWTVGTQENLIVKTVESDTIEDVVSSNSNVIEVIKIEKNIYRLTAKKVGTATITATSKNGAKKSYTYNVIEKPSISIPDYTSVLTVGKTYGKFTLDVIPKTDTASLISSDTSIIQIMDYGDNSWGLKAKKTGTVTITAKSSSGAKQEYKYTVVEEAKDLKMPKYPDEWNVGDTYEKFSITVVPSNSTVDLSSSDVSVIEVIKNGSNNWSLKAKKVGTATITASASNGLKTEYTYVVKQPPTITMPKYSNELEIGKTYGKFKLETNTAEATVTLISSNTSVIQVMKYGDNSIAGNSWGLKAKAAGTATITATSSAGAKVAYTYTVKQKTTISMPKYADQWTVGDEYGKFSVTVTPSVQDINVISSNTAVIQVIEYAKNSWGLKAKKAGTATITATAADGASTSYTYTVIEKPTVSIPNYSSEWTVGTSSKEFSAIVTPSGATVAIESSNSAVMEVINNGNNKWKLKAKKAGTATITVTSSAGAKAMYTYTVKEEPTIKMTKFEDELYVGKTYGKFSLETNTSDVTVSLISSNSEVLEVINHNTNSWSLKAKKAGTAQITATSSAGAKLAYTYSVIEPQLIMDDSDILKSVKYNYKMYLTVETVKPSNSTVTVSSSNSNVIAVSTIKKNTSWEFYAKGVGTATITVSSSNGLKKTYTCTVVEPEVKAMISMPKFSDTLDEGTETYRFSITVSPTSESVTLTSSNTDIIQIMKYGDNSSSGNSWALKAKKSGTATITASSASGVSQSYTYTVKKINATIAMTAFTSTWSSGNYGDATVTVTPSNSTVTVTSSNPTVMSVYKISNTTWRLKAIESGTATITASATNGKSISYTYTVNHSYPTAYDMIKNNNYETKTTGGVTIYIEKSCPSESKTNIINHISKLPNYARKSSKVVYAMTTTTWDKNGYNLYNGEKVSIVGWAHTGAVPYIWLRCDRDNVELNTTLYHEYGHAADSFYGAVNGSGYISSEQDFVTLYNNTYDYVSRNGCSTNSAKCSILRGYAYTNTLEFFAESHMMTVRPMVGYSNDVSDITSKWGPINKQKISPFGTVEEEMKKYIKVIESVIK